MPLTDSKGRNLLTLPIPPSTDGQAVQGVVLVNPDGTPATLQVQVTVQGGGGGGGDMYTYTHTQATPSSLWVIHHNLGRYPSVSVVDSAGNEGYGDVSYLLGDPGKAGVELTVAFSSPFSGKAFLN